MKDPTKYQTIPHTSSSKEHCCTELSCESGLRNNYFDGKRLTTHSFEVEQTYVLGRRHLLNRAIHGWGVVYGYELSMGDPSKKNGSGQLMLGPGLALDRCGRELLETKTTIQFSDVSLLNKDGKREDLDELLKRLGFPPGVSWDNPPRGPVESLKKECWLLSAHYAERDSGKVRIEDRCSCGHDEFDHVCETVRYSLQQVNCDDCCDPLDCELNCDCETGPCCDEPQPKEYEPNDYEPNQYTEEEKKEYAARGQVPPPREPRRPHQRGGCKCLCKHLTGLTVGGECGELCGKEEDCGDVRLDLKNGVPLACIRLGTDKCGLAFSEIIDACGPRRLVKRNDLLFDLIRGCDLTYISDYGWKPWHRADTAVPYQDFKNAFGPGGGNAPEYVTEKFWVEFSRAVRSETVRPDCFVMTVISSETDDRWWETSRVPIVRVEVPAGDLITRATIVVGGKWLRGAVRSDSTRLQSGPFRVELEVRGDFIVDCNGQTVDGNAHGRRRVPTGNGTPGGTFFSTFLVEAAPENSTDYEKEDRIKGVS